jgi:hypothetical protein
MFSQSIFAKKGPLAKIWLACHWERKLSKQNVISTDIPKSIHHIIDQSQIRIQSQLLLGIVKIYQRKTKYLLEDLNDAIVKIKMNLKPGVDLVQSAQAAPNQITLSLDLLLNEPILDLGQVLQSPSQSSRTVLSSQDNSSEGNDSQRFLSIDPQEFGRDPVERMFSPASFNLEPEVGRDNFSRLYSPVQSPLRREVVDLLGDNGALDFGFDDLDIPASPIKQANTSLLSEIEVGRDAVPLDFGGFDDEMGIPVDQEKPDRFLEDSEIIPPVIDTSNLSIDMNVSNMDISLGGAGGVQKQKRKRQKTLMKRDSKIELPDQLISPFNGGNGLKTMVYFY